MYKEENKLFYLDLHFNKVQGKALYDTKYTHNIMSTTFYNKIAEQINDKKSIKITATMADGNNTTINKLSKNVTFKINNIIFKEEFYIVKIKHDIILWLPWIQKNNAYIDWDLRCIYTKYGTLPETINKLKSEVLKIEENELEINKDNDLLEQIKNEYKNDNYFKNIKYYLENPEIGLESALAHKITKYKLINEYIYI